MTVFGVALFAVLTLIAAIHFCRAPVEPFASLNAWIYSPLCLVLGASFFLLLFMGET